MFGADLWMMQCLFILEVLRLLNGSVPFIWEMILAEEPFNFGCMAMKFKLNKRVASKRNFISLIKSLGIILGLSLGLFLFSSSLDASSLIFGYSCLCLWLISTFYGFISYFSIIEHHVLEITDRGLSMSNSKILSPSPTILLKKDNIVLGEVIWENNTPISISIVLPGSTTLTFDNYEEMEKILECLQKQKSR